jgi:VanZ like family
MPPARGSSVFTERSAIGTALRWSAFGTALSVVLFVTLLPTGSQTHGFARCIFCNPRTLADSIVNIGLFFPVGLTLRLLGLGPAAAAGLGALLSAGIEVAQLWVPGRDATLSDIITNTAGTVIAALGFDVLRRALTASSAARERLALGAAVGACAVWLTTDYLLRPSLPFSGYWGQWTPRLESLEPYGGQVNAVLIGGVAVPPHRVADSAGLRARLAARDPVDVEVTTGPPPAHVSSIFSIADDHSRRVALVGAIRDDLVFRFRVRAADWRLDQPDIRMPDAFADVKAGTRTTIGIRKGDAGYCARVGSDNRCGLGYGAGDGWALLVSSAALSSGMRSLMQTLWMAAIVAPVGYWARRGLLSGLAVATLPACLIALPFVTELLAPRPEEWGGLFLGLTAAGLLASRCR